MKILLKALLGLALLCVFVAAFTLCWFYLYSGATSRISPA